LTGLVNLFRKKHPETAFRGVFFEVSTLRVYNIPMTSSTKVSPAPLTREEALALAERCAETLRNEFRARRVIPFGSVRGDAPWRADSDIDLAVEGMPPELFFSAWSAVEQTLPPGIGLDLVDLRTVPPELRARILEEVEMPDDPIERLRGLIQDELTDLGRVNEWMSEDLSNRAELPTRQDLTLIANHLNGFYTGVERIFERILDWLGEPKPGGAYWHADLLKQVHKRGEGIRPPIIDAGLYNLLERLRQFRHFFRHTYGKDLDWSRMQPNAENMDETFQSLREQLAYFFDQLGAHPKT